MPLTALDQDQVIARELFCDGVRVAGVDGGVPPVGRIGRVGEVNSRPVRRRKVQYATFGPIRAERYSARASPAWRAVTGAERARAGVRLKRALPCQQHVPPLVLFALQN